jgi:thiamine phosphate synthase YjbQ (UPF0047 family)
MPSCSNRKGRKNPLRAILLVYAVACNPAAAFCRIPCWASSAKANTSGFSTIFSFNGKKASSSLPSISLGQQVCQYHQVTIPTSHDGPPRQRISVEDLTPTINELLKSSGLAQGTVTIISRHTTTSITINERESRLARDIEQCLVKLVPPDERSSCKAAAPGVRYLHNDIDERPESREEKELCRENGWDIDDEEQLEAWRAQEPINAHSHILSMLLGSSESVPVVDGRLVLGQWQSVLLVDLDGPRARTVGIQIMGFQ